MNRVMLQESLSAVMDDEADELELRRVLADGGDAQVRATWSRYQVARAAMHKELLIPTLDLTSGINAALDGEQAPLAKTGRVWGVIGRVAVAASVTVAVLAGVRFYHQSDVNEQLAQNTSTPSMSIPRVDNQTQLAGYSASADTMHPATAAPSAWHEQRVPSYLRQHIQQAGLTESPLPYARAATLENAKR